MQRDNVNKKDIGFDLNLLLVSKTEYIISTFLFNRVYTFTMDQLSTELILV